MFGILKKLRPVATPIDVSHIRVTVYSRQACGCCRKALDVLTEYQARYGFAIDVVDVDTDPRLAEAYGSTVPVVAFDDKVRFKGIVNPVLLERLLKSQAR